MGVAGCGKTTVGQLLAARLDLPFYDSDAFHPDANVEKMRNGIALTDADRLPWLRLLAEQIAVWERAGGAVLACSALKQRYRDLLAEGAPGRAVFVYLHGSRDLIAGRLTRRAGHFFPAALLDSQFATLEEPADAIRVSVELDPEQAAGAAARAIAGRLKGDA